MRCAAHAHTGCDDSTATFTGADGLMPPSYRQFEAITIQATPVYTCMAVPTFFWEVYRYSGGGLSQKYIIHVHLFYHHVCLVHVVCVIDV